MHSSYTVHHPPAAVAAAAPAPASVTVSTPRHAVSVTAPSSFSTAAIAASYNRASQLDKTLLIAGLVTFTSAAAYAAYTYWQRASSAPKQRGSSAAAAARPAAAARAATASSSAPHPQQTEFAAATAREQLSKPAAAASASAASTAATVTSLPPPLLIRLSGAQGILFDLDGTLVESAEIWYRLISGASTHFGYPPVSRDAWQATFGQSMEKNVEMWMAGLDQARFNAYCDEHYADHLQHLHILDGSLDLLRRVNSRYGRHRVAIVTNCPRHITTIILTHLALAPYFAHVVCAGDTIPTPTAAPALHASGSTYVLQPKPAIDILLQGAHQLGVGCGECVFVGDSRYDMLSGRAAGCVTVGVGIGTGDVVVSNTREAVTLFERL